MIEKASFGAGCFWGIEVSFRRVQGIMTTRVGYMGGWFKHPTYRDVCTGKTGHAEAVELFYDTDKISYEQLLQVFWRIHDPTTPNCQGPETGSQYRSIIFYHSLAQKEKALESRNVLKVSREYQDRRIGTEIIPAGEFFEAEEYHQQYYEKHNRCY